MSRLRALLTCMLLAAALPAMAADVTPPRLLFWHLEGDRVMVSNIRFSRSDEFRLRGRERIESTADATAMLVIVTNQRFIAYSVYTASWQTLSRQPGETLEQLTAEDYAAFVLTSRRVLNFNGRTANWSEGRR